MKVNTPNNNTAVFGARIKYNETMKQGFRLAKECIDSNDKSNLDDVKAFLDGIRSIRTGPSNDVFEPVVSSFQNQSAEVEDGGRRCFEMVNNYAAKLDLQKAPTVEMMKSHLEGALELVELLKENYAEALKSELAHLEKHVIKYSSK